MRVGALPIKLGASAPVRTTGSDGRVTAGAALAEIIGENPARARVDATAAMMKERLFTWLPYLTLFLYFNNFYLGRIMAIALKFRSI
jgi:hypothetical protein